MAVVSCFRRMPDGSFRRRPDVHFSAGTDFWLTPILPWGTERLVGLGEGARLLVVDAASGMVRQRATIAGETWAPPATAILLPGGSSTSPSEKPADRPHASTARAGSSATCMAGRASGLRFGGSPRSPSSSSLRLAADQLRDSLPPCLDLLGLDAKRRGPRGAVPRRGRVARARGGPCGFDPGGYLAAALAGPNRVVAIGPEQIDWLDAQRRPLVAVHRQ